MQKKLLSLIFITAISSSCSKDLATKDANQSQANSIQNQVQKNSNELVRGVVYFNTNSADLSQENIDSIQKALASFLSSNNKLVITVEGHCDERGSSKYNFKLGKKRAQVVKNLLTKKFGIKSSKISTISFGENKPVELNHDENAWSKNRRVEIVVLK